MKKVFLCFCHVIFQVFFLTTALAQQSAAPIRLGSILILTGEGSSWGNAAKNGIEMAIDEANENGGVLGRRLLAIHQDDQGAAKNAISAFHSLVDIHNVRLIIGPCWSTLGLPLIDLATRSKVLMISPTLGMAKFNESSKYLFNTWPHDYILSQKLAEYVFKKGHRRVALIGAEDVWVKEQTTAFKLRFEELGGEIAYLSEPLPGSTDLKTEAIKILSAKHVDAYVSTTDGIIVGSLVAKALRELNSTLATYSITLDQAAIDAAQGGFEGLEFLTFLTPDEKFKQEYESRFKTNIDIGADSAYDAVMLLVEAMRSTGSTDPEKLAEHMLTVATYQGVSGALISDGKGGFTKPYAVKRVVNGRPEEYNPDSSS